MTFKLNFRTYTTKPINKATVKMPPGFSLHELLVGLYSLTYILITAAKVNSEIPVKELLYLLNRTYCLKT